MDNRLDLDEDALIDNYEVISIIDSQRALSNDNVINYINNVLVCNNKSKTTKFNSLDI